MEPHVSSTEAEWIKLALQGDQDAFAMLVETYQKPVYNLCYRMMGSPQEAEDAAQESFWRAYRNLQHYDLSRSFPTWLLSIAAHYCIDQQRRRRLPLIELDELLESENFMPDPTSGPEKEMIRHEEIDAVQQQLQMMNSKDRAVLVLRYFYEFSEDEICKTLSISKSAVKSRLHRARLHMAEQLTNAHNSLVKGRQHETQTV